MLHDLLNHDWLQVTNEAAQELGIHLLQPLLQLYILVRMRASIGGDQPLLHAVQHLGMSRPEIVQKKVLICVEKGKGKKGGGASKCAC